MGKTIGSLFTAFPKEMLCQLYLHPSLPDTDACNSYYRITDRAVLMSYVKFKVHGEVVNSDSSQHKCSDESKSGQLYRKVKNVGVVKKLARDLLWKYACWYNRDLKRWIEMEAPTHMFVAPGMPKLLYYIAIKIARKHKLPIVTYICDDYYFLQKAKRLPERYMNWRVRKKIEQLLKASSHTVFICDSLAEAYNKKFDLEYTTIMTGASREVAATIDSYPNMNSLTYMGNLYYNRERSLADIGMSLDSINSRHQTSFKLHIYTGEVSSEVKKMYEKISSITLHGFVIGDELERVFKESDGFVHVEGFDEASRDLVKFSVSTKIADSLSCAKVFFAYGPRDVASIQYLVQNDCAFVVTDKKDINGKIEDMFFDEKGRVSYINRALQVAKKYHVTQHNSEKLYEIFRMIDGRNTQ